MVVHLLDELARELDGLDVRPERAAEEALEEALDLCSMLRSTLNAGIPPARELKHASRTGLGLQPRFQIGANTTHGAESAGAQRPRGSGLEGEQSP